MLQCLLRALRFFTAPRMVEGLYPSFLIHNACSNILTAISLASTVGPMFWCGGGDSNPGTPTGQGPKPSALYGCSAPLTWLRPFTFKLKVWQPPHIFWAGVRLSEPPFRQVRRTSPSACTKIPHTILIPLPKLLLVRNSLGGGGGVLNPPGPTLFGPGWGVFVGALRSETYPLSSPY